MKTPLSTKSRPAPLGTRDLTYIAAMTALMAVCAWIAIPAPVPITLQTFAVFLTLFLLGGRRGLIAICVYLLLGAVGLPVFTGFQGGMGVLAGATGGYIIGFMMMGVVYRGLEDESSPIRCAIALGIGLVVCYGFGTVWYTQAYAQSSGAVGYGSAFLTCVVPFILPDFVKLSLAMTLSKRLKKHLK